MNVDIFTKIESMHRKTYNLGFRPGPTNLPAQLQKARSLKFRIQEKGEIVLSVVQYAPLFLHMQIVGFLMLWLKYCALVVEYNWFLIWFIVELKGMVCFGVLSQFTMKHNYFFQSLRDV